MKLEDQVLSIEQVQELQELGFDIEKHSSMCWVAYTSDEEPYEKEYSLSILDEFCYESASLEPIPTMTIGDIIDILPIEIDEYVLNMNRKYVSYDSKQNSLYYGYRHRFIDSLFDCLVWCIKEKHIKL
jgi:phosphoenolpyruvate synthase/pyruvate phosphate dikinase